MPHKLIQKRETENLRSIIKKRKAPNKGKRVILKGQFHISTEELMAQVVEAEAATATSKKSKKSAQSLADKAAIEELDEEDIEEPYDSDLDELGW